MRVAQTGTVTKAGGKSGLTSRFLSMTSSGAFRVFMWASGAGLFAVVVGAAYQHFLGNVIVEFLQPLGRGYEFQVRNDTPSDRTILRLRVRPPERQHFIYTTTEDHYVKVGPDGKPEMPPTIVPAAEFTALDGKNVPANSMLKFRLPPLVNLNWMKPEATLVDVELSTAPSNALLGGCPNFCV